MVMWRMYIFRKRLKALRKVRCTMRPRVFWWRFNHRIRKKRQAAELLKSYLSARVGGLPRPYTLPRATPARRCPGSLPPRARVLAIAAVMRSGAPVAAACGARVQNPALALVPTRRDVCVSQSCRPSTVTSASTATRCARCSTNGASIGRC